MGQVPQPGLGLGAEVRRSGGQGSGPRGDTSRDPLGGSSSLRSCFGHRHTAGEGSLLILLGLSSFWTLTPTRAISTAGSTSQPLEEKTG